MLSLLWLIPARGNEKFRKSMLLFHTWQEAVNRADTGPQESSLFCGSADWLLTIAAERFFSLCYENRNKIPMATKDCEAAVPIS